MSVCGIVNFLFLCTLIYNTICVKTSWWQRISTTTYTTGRRMLPPCINMTYPEPFWGTSTRRVKHPMKFGDTTTQPNQLSVSSLHKAFNSHCWYLWFMLAVLMCVKYSSWLGPIESLRKYSRLLSDWTSICFLLKWPGYCMYINVSWSFQMAHQDVKMYYTCFLLWLWFILVITKATMWIRLIGLR